MIELRHDCSASDAESNPIIRRKMETTVVYRLRVRGTPDLNMNVKMSSEEFCSNFPTEPPHRAVPRPDGQEVHLEPPPRCQGCQVGAEIMKPILS